MHGQLISILGLDIPSYFAMLAIGFALATTVGALWARQLGHDPDVIVDLGIVMLIAGLVGARLAHVFFDGFFWDYVHLCTDPSKVEWKLTEAQCLHQLEPDFLGCGRTGPVGAWDAAKQICRPIQRDCLAWAAASGGLTYYGGFLAASVVGYFRLRRDGFPFLRAADMGGFAIPLGLSFGRMGCLLAGCCFGKPLTAPWAIVFPRFSPAAEKQAQLGLLPDAMHASLPVHPTQLYEALGALAISALLLLWLHPRKRYDGQVFIAFVTLYATLRFLLEFLRSDDRGGLLGLSTSQLIGLGLGATALLANHWLARRNNGVTSLGPSQ